MHAVLAAVNLWGVGNALGDVTLRVMATPGHTPESISVLVYERPEIDSGGVASGEVAYGVLTGDALFIGDVGRPDLLASVGHTAEDLGRMLYDSVQRKLMALPEEPFIRFAGLLSDDERLQALQAATVVVCPSPYESLSLLALEAMGAGTPVLANARSEVLVEHCIRSNAGLWYADRNEFIECLNLLVADSRLREILGRNGRDYVRRNYKWDVVLGKYDRLFAKVRNAR